MLRPQDRGEKKGIPKKQQTQNLTVAPQRFWATFGCLLETSYRHAILLLLGYSLIQ
jgi:hypothetical protein